MLSYEEFCANCDALERRVRAAADACGRDASEIKILPVTKTHPAEVVEYAFRRGFTAVGENRVQEALEKMPLFGGKIEWELIGHLQSNKALRAVENFNRIESVDSEHLLLKLDACARSMGKVQRILLQVNAGNDPAKFGVDAEAAAGLLEAALNCANLSVEGLMTIAPLDSDLDVASRCFGNLRKIRDCLSEKFSVPLSELSMGMSADLERAIAEGSTLIRVGSFLFGSRQ